jgi:hypothetical protein
MRRLQEALHAAKIAEAAAWIMGSLAVLCVVAWHDAMVKSYWGEQYAAGSLFLTQRHFQRGRGPSAEPVGSYALWLSIMRYEADVSVGLLAASAVVVLVTAARRCTDRRSCGGPGAVACSTAVAAMGLCVLEEASLAAKEGRGLWKGAWNPFPNAWPNCELWIGLAVFGAWVVMVGARLWRPRGTWADRIGIVIGAFWICLIIYRITASIFIPFGNWRY